MIRSFEESVERFIRGYPSVKKDGYFKHNVRYPKRGEYFLEVVCHNERKTDHKNMRTVWNTGIMSLAARHDEKMRMDRKRCNVKGGESMSRSRRRSSIKSQNSARGEGGVEGT